VHRPSSNVNFWLLALLGFSFGCGNRASTRLEIELAPTFEPGDPLGDRQCRADARALLPSNVDCVSITACRKEGRDCTPVRVLRTSDDHGNARHTELRFSRSGTDNQIQFDLELAPDAEHELEIHAYAAGRPYAKGRASGVRAGDPLLRVRLEPYGRWTCAGLRADGGAPLARALHQTVALPNGDALVVGGVTGEGVQPLSVEGGAVLQRAVELYDASESRFYEIQVTDLDGASGIGAVFHRAFYLETTSDARYRVRVIGGFTSLDQPGARFDALQGLTQYSSPVLPAARAEVRDSVDLLYDPRTRAIEVALVDPGVVRRAGMNAVSEPDANGLVTVALGLLDGGGSALRPMPMLSGQWYSLPLIATPSAMAMPMLAPRFGHTATRFNEASVLIWGGNVTMTSTDEVSMRAGEMLGAGAGVVPSNALGRPPATAFHSANQIAGGILIAGGMEVTPGQSSGGVSTTPSSQPLTVLSLDPVGQVIGTPIAFDAAMWPTPIFHAATELPDGSVIVTGGAVRWMPPGAASPSHLWASDHVIRVIRDAAGAYSAVPLARMIGPRWGHTMTLLPGDRVLVIGGFVREEAIPDDDFWPLRAISSAEILLVADAPPPITSCGTPPTSDGGAPNPG
jgi:hypothetical protein